MEPRHPGAFGPLPTAGPTSATVLVRVRAEQASTVNDEGRHCSQSSISTPAPSSSCRPSHPDRCRLWSGTATAPTSWSSPTFTPSHRRPAMWPTRSFLATPSWAEWVRADHPWGLDATACGAPWGAPDVGAPHHGLVRPPDERGSALAALTDVDVAGAAEVEALAAPGQGGSRLRRRGVDRRAKVHRG